MSDKIKCKSCGQEISKESKEKRLKEALNKLKNNETRRIDHHKAIQLRADGLTIEKISKILKCSKTAIVYAIRNY